MHLLLESLDYTFEIDRRDRALVIGRLSDCDYVVIDSLISRKHSEVEFKKGNWVIRDLGSKYGTIVNGNPAKKEHRLNNGDLIKLGGQTFKVSLVKDQSEKPVAKLEVKAKNKEKPAPKIPDNEPTPKTPAAGVGAVDTKDGEKARPEDVIAHLAKSKTKKDFDRAKEDAGEEEKLFESGPVDSIGTAVMRSKSATATAPKRTISSPALDKLPVLTGPVIEGKERRSTQQVKRRTVIQTKAEQQALLPKGDRSKIVLASIFGVAMIAGIIAYGIYGGKAHPKAPADAPVAAANGKPDDAKAPATQDKAASGDAKSANPDAKPGDVKAPDAKPTDTAAATPAPAPTDTAAAPAPTPVAATTTDAAAPAPAATPAPDAKPADAEKKDAPAEKKEEPKPAAPADAKPADPAKPADLP